MTLDGTEFHLVNTVDEAAALMRWLGERPAQLGAIALDTEGTGLSPEQDSVRLVQVGDDRTGWAIPFDDWRGVVQELVSKWDGRIIMHNAVYDAAMLKSEGIQVDRSRVDDTRLAGHVLEPTESTALKNQTSRHVDPRAASLQRALDEFMTKWTWATVPIEEDGPAAIYWQYGALDAILTYQLADVHLPKVRTEAPKAYELELGAAWTVSDMARRGAVIDREYTEENSKRFLEYVDRSGEWCEREYDAKPGSNQRIIEIIMRDTNYEFTKCTKANQRPACKSWPKCNHPKALDKDVLDQVIRSTGHPLAETVLKRRQTQKLQSTYLRRFLQYSEFDGLLHPSINSIGGSDKSMGATEGLFGVRTGRMSMDTPNLQQLPRRNASNLLAAVVRNCITARPGHVLLMPDFDQIEFRILAHLADDPGLRAAFLSDVDFFTDLARNIFNDDSIVKSDPRRQTTKNSGYAKAYGSGPAKFAQTAGIALSEAVEFLGRLDRLYPGIVQLQRTVDRLAAERLAAEGVAYVRSPLTGRRHTADDDRGYALLNYLIQGSAAELFKMKLLELDAAGLGEYMILPVHDEIILDVPLEDELDVVRTIYEVMNDDQLLSVPITAGMARGFRWGEKEDIDDAFIKRYISQRA